MKIVFAVFSSLLLICVGTKTHIKGPHVDVARNIKVMHGHRASKGEYPFQVSLQIEGEHHCGATILNEKFILTAAHCIYSGIIDNYTIRAGTNNYKRGGSVHKVVHWVYHELYEENIPCKNDIAVLEVDPPLTFRPRVQPTRLPSEGEEPDVGAKSVAIGWGSKNFYGPCRPQLHEVSLNIYSHQECLDVYWNLPTTDMVCSGAPYEQGQVCSGDSGGPLLVNGIQVGITSWGAFPCVSYPTVWTRVSHYRSWIREKSGV
ncbi:chymotrypsin-1-like [Periplaneta americana]|uniref:chymotrypsin-1-like n=1 Tax=Periplaneta americana TaxID=6978 RepID=UPI0037E8A7FC